MRTILFANGKAYGTVRGGIPIVVENANRKLRRLAARQAKERAPGSAQSEQPNIANDQSVSKEIIAP